MAEGPEGNGLAVEGDFLHAGSTAVRQHKVLLRNVKILMFLPRTHRQTFRISCDTIVSVASRPLLATRIIAAATASVGIGL